MSTQQPCCDPPTNWPSYYQRPSVRATTRKLAEPEVAPVCFDSQHMPPTMQVFSPGLWEHTCPSCGLVTVFRVSR